MATVAPRLVRPPGAGVEAIIRSLALPTVPPAALWHEVERAGGVVAAWRRLERRVLLRLGERSRVRVAGWADRALRTLAREPIHVLTPELPEYPASLHHLDDPPYALFAVGRLELLRRRAVAVVGTRRATRTGLDAAGRISGGLAAAGVVVISGLADGIDTAAHRAAGAARTIGVLGCGVDVTYPRSNTGLQAEIGRLGLLLSEQPPGMPPLRQNFPLRNRLIAALSEATVVVEAPFRSGALITAHIALDHGRSVMAVPGSIAQATSAGTNELIRDGAKLVTGPLEVLEELGIDPPAEALEDGPPPELAGAGLALWRLLGPEPRHVDELAAETGLDPHQSLASLLSLEVLGHVRQLPGFRFVRS